MFSDTGTITVTEGSRFPHIIFGICGPVLTVTGITEGPVVLVVQAARVASAAEADTEDLADLAEAPVVSEADSEAVPADPAEALVAAAVTAAADFPVAAAVAEDKCYI